MCPVQSQSKLEGQLSRTALRKFFRPLSSCVDGHSLQLFARVKFALTLRLLEDKVNTTSSLAVMTNVDISATDSSLDPAAVAIS